MILRVAVAGDLSGPRLPFAKGQYFVGFRSVIGGGGQIFFAVDENGQAVGTVALIRVDADSFELAKMAISPTHRGLGLGDQLMQACISHAAKVGVHTIVLESNTKQTAALKLYRKFGFFETPLDPNSHFVRANIRMELAINDVKR